MSTQNTEHRTDAQREKIRQRMQSRRIEIKVTPKHEIPLKVPKLPPADSAVRHKVRVHICCVVIGGLLAILVSFVSGGLIHWVPFLPTLPNVAYEALDRIYNR